ncbi:cysteine hydrolase family protein [Chryseobacterium sp. ISL-6]|uniref:cysteine hydrolase family protein n=1 Tax=Chryseobacterium sp. ISL-6 TaxID=2819143 RepID=UPI001BE72CF4|nr:cysteine hydrolase family protein [Chryseobacterium sp. ISL-6]MBT2619643.1 cysteine hydrolase [Chryseobacterium sp. ISL-6]
MKEAFLIIDIQNDYFPDGKHILSGSEQAGRNACKVLEYVRSKKNEIIHIQHLSVNEGADFFLPDTYGAEINAFVQPVEGERIIIKNYPNSFRNTDLLAHLQKKGIKNLIICGMMTDVCVDATVRAAMDLGFKTTVIGDACATENRELYGEAINAKEIHSSYLAGFTALGNLYANVMSTEEFLKER